MQTSDAKKNRACNQIRLKELQCAAALQDVSFNSATLTFQPTHRELLSIITKNKKRFKHKKTCLTKYLPIMRGSHFLHRTISPLFLLYINASHVFGLYFLPH